MHTHRKFVRAFSVGAVLGTLVGAFADWACASGLSLTRSGEYSLEIDIRGKPMPNWSGGALIVVESVSSAVPFSIGLFNKQGQRVATHSFWVPGAAHLTVRNFVHGTDGTVALCGSVADSRGRGAGYLGWISASDGAVRIVRTDPYGASRVAIASDGTIWTAGIEERNPDAPVFRRFDRSGKMIGAFVSQSEFRNPHSSLLSSTNVFGAIGDRIVWYSSREGELVEVSPDGVVSRIQGLFLPNNEAEGGFAITEDGEIFVSSRGRSSASISRLDRGVPAWIPVVHDDWSGQAPRPSVYLYGADGNILVGWDDSRRLKFFEMR
jgi:hypothetical protein